MTHHVLFRWLALVAVTLCVATCRDVNVTAVEPARIEITPDDPAVKVEETLTLSARVLSRDGRALPGRSIAWRSTNASVADVDAAGVVSGVTAGSTFIHATSGDASDSVLFTVEPPDPSIVLAPTSLAFTGMRGEPDPDALDVQITNAGGRVLDDLTATVAYAGGQTGGWLTAELSSGVAPATLTVAVAIGTLAPGAYAATINVASSSADNSPQSIAVSFDLADALPAIGVSATTATFSADIGGTDPAPVTIDVTNAGGRTLDGLAATVVYPSGQPDGWLTADLDAGTAPTSLTLSAAADALPIGTHTATVRLTSNAAANSRVNIAATIVISDVPPTAPTNLSTSVVSPTQVDLAWEAATGTVDDYRIERRTGTGGAWNEIDRVDADVFAYESTALSAATQYGWRVSACNAVGCSPASNEAYATTYPLPPGTPGTLTAATVSSSRIDLSWGVSTGTVAGYRIERRTGSGAYVAIDTITGTSYQDDGLAAATSYTYRVRACNAGGCSAYGNPSTATTLPDPPAIPASFNATTSSSTEIELSWTGVTGPVTEYRLERRTGGGGFTLHETLPGTATTFDDDGLTPATSYTYRVQACNAGGCSAFSSEATATTHPLPPGTPGTLVASIISATRIDLAWGASSGIVAGYEIERRSGADAYTLVATVSGATTFQNTALTAGTGYGYRVRACNAGGCSAFGNEVSATTLPNPPTAPTLSATAVDASSIDLSWSGATGTITEYRVERVSPDAAIVAVLNGMITAHRDVGLTANTAYVYRVQACNPGGCSAYSNEAGATTLP